MSVKNHIKSLIFKLPDSWVHCFYSLYNDIAFPEYKQSRKCYGNSNVDKVFYVIRPRPGKVEGLMALYLDVIKQLNSAEKKNFIPVVDFQNYETQYDDGNIEAKNTWEYYFRQTAEFSLDEVYHSKNVVLSGLNAIENCDDWLRQKFDEESLSKVRRLVQKYISFSDDANNLVEKEIAKIDTNKTIGLYLRGTDYTTLKPAGHPVQPTAEQAIKVVDKMMSKYGFSDVFLTTEDFSIYSEIKLRYGDHLKLVSYDSFIKDYRGGFLSNDSKAMDELSESPYYRGLNYLCKLIILSKCKVFVGGNTSGSWAACTFSKGFTEQYIFDLGRY